MERNVKHLLLRKTNVLKKVFWERKFEEMHFLKGKKGKKLQGIFGGTFIFSLSSFAVFHLQNPASDFF